LLLLLVHREVLHDLEVRLCPHHDRLCYRLDLLTLRSATLGLISFARVQR
jgi:aminoglycoside phosphotransferase